MKRRLSGRRFQERSLGLFEVVVLSAAVFVGGIFPGSAKADVVRCEVVDRTHDFVPEWIEYKIGLRGTTVELRDSEGVRLGRNWVRGKVLEMTERRMTLAWDMGMRPIGSDFSIQSTSVNMRMTRLPDGRILVIGVPSLVAYGNTETYNGRALCTG